MMIMIVKTCGSQVLSPVVEGKTWRREGGERGRRDLYKDTYWQAMSARKGHGTAHWATWRR